MSNIYIDIFDNCFIRFHGRLSILLEFLRCGKYRKFQDLCATLFISKCTYRCNPHSGDGVSQMRHNVKGLKYKYRKVYIFSLEKRKPKNYKSWKSYLLLFAMCETDLDDRLTKSSSSVSQLT